MRNSQIWVPEKKCFGLQKGLEVFIFFKGTLQLEIFKKRHCLFQKSLSLSKKLAAKILDSYSEFDQKR